MFSDKFISIALLVVAELLTMSLWFLSAAALPDMVAEAGIDAFIQGLLTSSVSAGFVVGALVIALFGIADRFNPKHVFALFAFLATLINLSLFLFEVGGIGAVMCRFLTGFCLAGVYPVGMKIAVGWGREDRGLLVGVMVGALTIGSAAPFLTIYLGGMEWRVAVFVASVMSLLGGVMILFSQTGPYHAKATGFQFSNVGLIWTDKRLRYPFLGYLGHMWELYAMWAWISSIAALSFRSQMSLASAVSTASLITFFAIALGGVASIFAGFAADKIGKSQVTIIAMAGSGMAAIGTALSFGGPFWLLTFFVLLWGMTIIPDSAQFSALIADHSPAEHVGSLMTLQTALGFSLTIFTVQGMPLIALMIGWPLTICVMAAGPFAGIYFMVKYLKL